LHQAADGNVVRLLLKRGAAIDRRDPVGGMTALHAACAAGWLGVAETLIDGGADVNARTEGTSNPGITPLGFAVGGHPEITNLLLSRGVDQRLGDSYGAGPLLYAAASGDVESMRLLVEHGTPIGDRNKFGATALHFASMKSRLLAAEWLLDKGLKADVSDDLDSTPLMGTGSVEMMELLARRGANPSRKNTVGRTALHVAAEQGRIEAAEWLIKMGVPVGSRDESGNTPLQGARAAGREEIAKWLIAHGANE
jgi:ankyrin repeat protein